MERNRSSLKGHPFRRFLHSLDLRRLAIFLTVYLAGAFFIAVSHFVPNLSRFVPGHAAPQTIRSEYTFSYLDRTEQEPTIREFESTTPDYYRRVESYRSQYSASLSNFLRDMTLPETRDFLTRIQNERFVFSSGTLNYILSNRLFLSRYANRLNYLYSVLVSSYILIDQQVHQESHQTTLPDLMLLEGMETNRVPREKSLPVPLDKGFVLTLIGRIYTGMDNQFRDALAEIFINLVRPNALYDRDAKDRMLQALLKKSFNYQIIRQDDFLVRRGEMVTPETAAKVQAYVDYKKRDLEIRIWLYYILSFTLYLLLISRLHDYEMDVFKKDYNVAVAMLAFVFVNGIYTSTYVTYEIPYLPFFLTIPFAVATITLPLLLKNTRAALILLISYALFFIFYPSFEIISFLNFLFLSLLTLLTSRMLKSRTDFFKVALILGLIECGFTAVYAGYYRMTVDLGMALVLLLFALGNAFICAIIGSGIMPLLENIFNIPTRFRLLELTNPTTSPLLKRLKTEAQGTYNHSLLLGDMSEAAAERIGVDSLLVKAGGYYHDIGKAEIPHYFIENQDGPNKHDDIKPSISASVIKSHVKMGVELSRKHHLPEEVIDYIREHHGTTAISYFYHQALGLYGDKNVSIQDYEYTGPKPRTKGTAILMLADGVEASVRAYAQNNDNFTTGIIQDIIDDIIKKRLEKGQLDECDITLHDLRLIGQEFFKFLSGYYHKRIEYPKK